VTGDDVQRLVDEPERRREVSSVELVEAVLGRIEAADELRAFISVTPELVDCN